MKTLFNFSRVLTLFLCVNIAYAQDNNIGTRTRIEGEKKLTFKYQDSIAVELLRYNIQMTDFPLIDPCERIGIAPICLTDSIAIIQPFMPDNPETTDPTPNDDTHPYEPPIEGDINIYWIHGLNGDVNSWERAAHATEFGMLNGDPSFPARKAHSIIGNEEGDQTYGETGGITYASTDMRDIADASEIIHTRKDYIIAHSQGGIVAREWLRNIDEKDKYPNYVHGLVTFGTSHTGAMILNNTRGYLDGKVNPQNKAVQFFNEACIAIVTPAIVTKVNDNFVTRLLVSDTMQKSLINKTCNTFSGTIVPFALDNYHKATTDDYYVGSPFLTSGSVFPADPTNAAHPTGLSDYELKVPVVQFYGVEESPVIWRFFSSTRGLGEDQISGGNPAKEFGYDKDDQLQLSVANIVNEFTAGYNNAKRNYDYWNNRKCWLLFRPTTMGLYAWCKTEKEDGKSKNHENMTAYNGAVVWLSNADNYYQTLIVGAKVVESEAYCMTEKIGFCKKQVWDVNEGRWKIVNDPLYSVTERLAGANPCQTGVTQVNHNNCEYKETITTVYKNTKVSYKANDGVVLAESAAAPVKIDKSNPDNTLKFDIMPGTNHIQMRNCSETKKKLTKLYDGGYGPAFAIDPR
jgi:pimeloyl-ACP methyl ester carboxylesterase